MEKLRYAIIGCGNISPKHLNGYSALSDQVEIVAYCDLIPEKMEKAAARYGKGDFYTDYHELLDRPDIDFVSICLPNDLHAKVAIEALEKGKHVHSEKPMAMNSKETAAMIAARDKSGKELMIGLNNRFTPFSYYVKRLVDSGMLGEIYFSRTGWIRRAGLAVSEWFLDKERSGGGPLIDLGVHYIDLVMYFMGYPELESVLAKTFAKFGPTDKRPMYTFFGSPTNMDWKCTVEDLAVGHVNLKNGSAMQFEMSWASNIEKELCYYELYGTEAGLRFEKHMTGYDQQKGDGSVLKIFQNVNGQMVTSELDMNTVLEGEGEFQHFVNCIREGKHPTVSVVEQAAQTIRLIEGIYESAGSGKQVFF